MKKVEKEKLARLIEKIRISFADAVFFYSENDSIREFAKLLANTEEKISLIENELVVSILGGTNSGKSTTVNALFDEKLSSVSPQAPHDTTSIVIVHKDRDFHHDLIDFGPRIVKHHSTPALKDTIIICGVDFDSIELANQISSRKIFHCSDLICFICTPEKYSDNTFFSYLTEAFELEKQIVIVVNKSSLLSDEEINEIRADLTEKLQVLGSDKVRTLFCDAKNAFEKNEHDQKEFDQLRKLIFEELFKNKNAIKLKEINSEFKNISLKLNVLHRLYREEEERIQELITKLQELKQSTALNIERLFTSLELKFNEKLEKLVDNVAQANAYLRLTSFLKKIYNNVFSFSNSESEDKELAHYIFSLFYPDYSEYQSQLQDVLNEQPLETVQVNDAETHLRTAIVKELKNIDEELKNKVSEEVEDVFGTIIKKDMSALLTSGVLLMLFSLNGLLLTEILVSLFGGFFVSESGRRKAMKLVDKIKSETVENLRKKIKDIFFQNMNKVFSDIEDKKKKMSSIENAMSTKGEVELLREEIGETIGQD